MEAPLNIIVTLADVGRVISANNEFKLAVENEALKRMLREMQANGNETVEEESQEPEAQASGQAAD